MQPRNSWLLIYERGRMMTIYIYKAQECIIGWSGPERKMTYMLVGETSGHCIVQKLLIEDDISLHLSACSNIVKVAKRPNIHQNCLSFLFPVLRPDYFHCIILCGPSPSHYKDS